MFFQQGLRYRGTDITVKKQYEKQVRMPRDKKTKIPPHFSVKADPTFIDEDRFKQPPHGVRVSHAYPAERTFLNKIKNQIPDLLIEKTNQFYKITISLLKQTPMTLSSLYDKASVEEKKFVHSIASQVKEHHLTQIATSTFGINPLLYAIILMFWRTSSVEAEYMNTTSPDDANSASSNNSTVQPRFTFFNGAPTDETDLCKATPADLCEQFYVTENEQIVAQGASFLTSTRQRIADVKKAVAPCSNVTYLEHFLHDALSNRNKTTISNETCTTSAYSYGRTIHLDQTLTRVSQEICSALAQQSDTTTAPCVAERVYNAFDQTPSPRQPSTQQTPPTFNYYFLIPMWVTAISVPIIIACMRRSRENEETRRARESSDQQQNSRIAPASTERVIELASVAIDVSEAEPSQQSRP